MAVPKKKRSLRRRRIRRNIVKNNNITIVSCNFCNSKKMLHYICSACGNYK